MPEEHAAAAIVSVVVLVAPGLADDLKFAFVIHGNVFDRVPCPPPEVPEGPGFRVTEDHATVSMNGHRRRRQQALEWGALIAQVAQKTAVVVEPHHAAPEYVPERDALRTAQGTGDPAEFAWATALPAEHRGLRRCHIHEVDFGALHQGESIAGKEESGRDERQHIGQVRMVR